MGYESEAKNETGTNKVENAIALGNKAKAKYNNAIAVGYSSETTRENEVSFGREGTERYIANVKAAEKDTDAVNKK
ncbi:TPA: hypothetical protein ACPHRJ_001244 [Haemophilus influenzae]|uniref:hypothetical protein n=1 Tax=Haemophilus influenzae TaxID=727 RepID=UPI0009B296F1